jgi:transcriptional regulator with XRE-family HTH domain
MVDYRLEATLGARVAAARKARGIRSTKALSELIGNGTVTEATLQNIEAGRLTNLSVSQLLNIAFALKVAPSFLLAPLAKPDSQIDLQGLSDGLTRMTVSEFDGWLSGANDGRYRPTTAAELSERTELEALRALENLLRERTRLEILAKIEADASESGVGEKAWDRAEDKIAVVKRQINEARQYLETAGWLIDGSDGPGERG